jgi:hypothetical protein
MAKQKYTFIARIMAGGVSSKDGKTKSGRITIPAEVMEVAGLGISDYLEISVSLIKKGSIDKKDSNI